MKDEITEEQSKAILEALDNAINEGPWEESNFLRVIGKNLRQLRDKFSSQTKALNQDEKIASNLANRIALRSGQREIFIALYSSTGSNIQSWTHILANLPRQIISRPIYANEQDVKEVIRTKENQNNEGYVAIYINKDDILPTHPDKIPTDKLGKPLLSLKDKAIKVENINRFVHISGVYKYLGGRLVKINSNESA
ncbi:Dot/Icm secretion system protein IcmQ [Legionella impletisoli]|uniref:Dot/Icm secretion system protein IcmQ n=1 Tax=Legionella impletisoli TaxID=343510 RepID=A0A917JWR7_9GAMM|nr:Dot/Icm secretion system protein IcmQ [Legionella impletisoli]GGI89951.1 Dot/Icm secretion system protein IcmQ [Legionella impletisoli]